MSVSRHLWHPCSQHPEGTWKCQNTAKTDLKLYMRVGLNLLPFFNFFFLAPARKLLQLQQRERQISAAPSFPSLAPRGDKATSGDPNLALHVGQTCAKTNLLIHPQVPLIALVLSQPSFPLGNKFFKKKSFPR